MKYYVYKYLREDNTPYYIGKGSGNRINEKHNVVLPIKERRVIIADDLSEQEAFDLEIELILKYGRKDLGTGILRNQTNGGDGVSGYRYTEERKIEYSKRMKQINAKRKEEGWEYPDSARKTISKMWKNKPKSKEHVEKVRVAKASMSNEAKAAMGAKISASKKGKPRTEETKAKIRKSILAKHRSF